MEPKCRRHPGHRDVLSRLAEPGAEHTKVTNIHLSERESITQMYPQNSDTRKTKPVTWKVLVVVYDCCSM